MRALLSALAGLLAASAEAWDSSTVFEQTALAFRAQTIRCYAVRRPASLASWRRGIQSIESACCFHWPNSATEYWEPMLVLAYTESHFLEAGNPVDPSYGRWGVTLPAARWVCNPRSGTGVQGPKTDRALIRKLERDDAFNAMVAAGVLKICMARSRGLERAVLRYKMGLYSCLCGAKTEVRRMHWRDMMHVFRRARDGLPCRKPGR